MKSITIAILAFVCVAAWWLESRFDATVAIMVLGGALGVICVVVGYFLSMANTKYTLNSASQFNHDLAQSERYRQMTGREYARGEREAFAARAKLEIIEAKRVDQIAQQRAGLLVDLERQRWDENQRQKQKAAMWDDDEPAGSMSEWE